MLNKMFNANNPFWQSMGTIFDLFVLNSLLLVCSIPIFTIGPALTAFNYTLLQRALREEGYVTHDFFYSFKQNFKQGIALGLPLTLVGIFLFTDMYLCRKAGTGIYSFFLFFFLALFVFWIFICLYAFPLLSKFDKKNKEILLWAFMLSLKKFPMTLFMTVITVFGFWLIRPLPFLIFIIFGILGQVWAPMMASVIKPYIDDAIRAQEEKEIQEASQYADAYTGVLNLETIEKLRAESMKSEE